MPVITLPDGSQRSFDQAVSVLDVASSIGPGLAKAALAGRVDGRLVDASHVIGRDAELAIITERDADGIDIIRHSTAHLLAQAVKQLFPDAQVTIGPTIEDGFYYDFAYQRPFTAEDLQAIEAKMGELAKADHPVSRQVMPRDQALRLFRDMGEAYKAELIESIPAGEDLSLYTQGEFTDLCRGPHVPSTGRLKAFKLMKLAGAYWRGDSRNEMLQRVYGTAWRDKKELKAYLTRLEEAEKRDHRKIGKAQDLFHTQEEAPGMVFWHDKGWQVYLLIQAYIRDKLRDNGYQEVHTPQVIDRSLWEKSGHWDKFGDMIFTTHSENRDFAIKPMNCPAHIQIYNHGLKSYRDLPLRLAEFGSCHRNEPSGTLHGLMRVRNFVQDDAHIFCTEDQILPEVSDFIDLLFEIYRDFGFNEVLVKLSTRPEQRVGEDALWDKAERSLQEALDQKGLAWELQPGEGAFYGPKIEFSLKDCLNRVWQCGTIQLDFSMPGRLDASYIAEDNSKQVPVMLHRAILGSLERFIGILIEEYAGAMPLWLAPVQAVVMNITDRQSDYVKKVAENLNKQGFRVETDLRNEKIGFKIREHALARVPFLLVVGDREMENETLAVRTRGGEDLGSLTVEALVQRMGDGVARRSN
ncbi:MAG: threonine--tRNA ligase [Candidatus Sedimenticola endophacoides]|uniref:Threonine--tRNA ligase n=2 Tax=Candidatus Sedimenticola endophacoides TaxID=2548426 RepID=A0A6N4E0Q9_9GAMM|nr:MAG: threonine--tRNA ligase [Candidatus Sedimenticola endophacoides]OQX34539.1 MAG: threonine--tRNA ligase [Candidatus Sedimenticola endophacoides]OQX41650.1 MAG: threonine--tRNA ligase [Candidatus Sedimenticola endophacoides]OQX43906.1 MAG: threonine--tRNA ligase [Candidatus Sedimenticola endophacoides]PUD98968.1 MAG: threonine--tRNA ligase [Candidatus Sedimenticola endophacoides]